MTSLRLLLATAAIALVAVVVAFGVVGQGDRPAAAAAADDPADVDGLRYEVDGARPLDERGDATVIRALPSGARATRGTLLYGVFVSVSNPGRRPQPSARRFELVDARGTTFSSIPLRDGSAFAYRPQVVGPGDHLPPQQSPVADDMAEQGFPLVFRVSRSAHHIEDLSLRIFDPSGRTAPDDVPVQA